MSTKPETANTPVAETNGAVGDTLSTDNRTGQSYEIPIEDGRSAHSSCARSRSTTTTSG
jgi:hypothetical protein